MKYQVMLSFRMIVALVDISEKYEKEDSPRWDARTITGLARRSLVRVRPEEVTTNNRRKLFGGATLTKKGKTYLEMCLFEYATAEDVMSAAKPRRKREVA